MSESDIHFYCAFWISVFMFFILQWTKQTNERKCTCTHVCIWTHKLGRTVYRLLHDDIWTTIAMQHKRMDGLSWPINLEYLQKDVVIAYFIVLSQHFLGKKNEKNHNKHVTLNRVMAKVKKMHAPDTMNVTARVRTKTDRKKAGRKKKRDKQKR
jgi:hypothetical protein